MVSHRSNVCTQPRKTLSWESHTNHFSSSHSHVRLLFRFFFYFFSFCCFDMLFVYRISNCFQCVLLCLFPFSLFRNFWINLQCILKMKSFFCCFHWHSCFMVYHGMILNDLYWRFCIAVSSGKKMTSYEIQSFLFQHSKKRSMEK